MYLILNACQLRGRFGAVLIWILVFCMLTLSGVGGLNQSHLAGREIIQNGSLDFLRTEDVPILYQPAKDGSFGQIHDFLVVFSRCEN